MIKKKRLAYTHKRKPSQEQTHDKKKTNQKKMLLINRYSTRKSFSSYSALSSQNHTFIILIKGENKQIKRKILNSDSAQRKIKSGWEKSEEESNKKKKKEK